jgi:outer membrane protein assembly factor BamB
LWETAWTPSTQSVSGLSGIVAGPTAVVAFGWGRAAPGLDVVFLAQAYDPLTGAVLWDIVDNNPGFLPSKAAINRNRFFAAGDRMVGFASRHLQVTAYDVQSGTLDWEFDRPDVFAHDVRLAGGRLFIAGRTQEVNAAGELQLSTTYLGSFSPRTGTPLWENPSGVLGYITDIAVKGSRLVAGVEGSLAVQSYDANSGILEWQDAPARDARAFAVALNDKSVYIAGVGFNPAPSVVSELMVRAYEAGTGRLLWDDRSHPSTASLIEQRFASTGMDIALGKFRLFVVGYSIDPDASPDDADFVVRAYDIRSDVTTP